MLIMSSLVIFFVVFVAVVPQNNVMGSISAQEIDLDKLLELVQQQRINRAESSDTSESDDSDDSDSSSEEIARAGKVGGDNLIDIINQVINNNNNNNKLNTNRKNRKGSHERALKYSNRNSKNENLQRTNKMAEILEQFLNKGFKESEPKWQPTAKPKKRLTPNRLLGNIKGVDDGLENYSKIYILLNPQAIQRSKDNKSAVNKMISKILSLSSPPVKREEAKPKQRRYKGFAIKENIGRRLASRENIDKLRKSNSVYAPKDSDLEDKPKRSHNGGGGAGHTAIPYIRHRGENIYERDN